MLSKESYITDSDVIGFKNYLINLIKGNKTINHSYIVERQNTDFPGEYVGKKFNITTLESAFKNYSWNRESYEQNKSKLDNISKVLKTNDEQNLYDACLACLEWGAGGTGIALYTRNKTWIDEKINQGININQLLDGAHKQVSSNQPDLDSFTSDQHRMNSGFTKIYALRYDDFIIYDSRVAAALGLLVVKYCKSNNLNEIPENLKFHYAHKYPNGGGIDKRNPCIGEFQFPKLNNDSRKHAESNIKANWLLGEIVSKEEGFWGIGDHSECLRALEAALFMVGYSVITHESEVTVKSSTESYSQNDTESNNGVNRVANADRLWGVLQGEWPENEVWLTIEKIQQLIPKGTENIDNYGSYNFAMLTLLSTNHRKFIVYEDKAVEQPINEEVAKTNRNNGIWRHHSNARVKRLLNAEE